MTVDIEKVHREILIDEVYKKVGETHSKILLADNLLEAKQYEPVDRTVEFDFKSPTPTAFGEATIGDFTGYFLRNNIEILLEFKERLEAVHPYLDSLKRDSKKLLESYEFKDYRDFISQLHQFFIDHQEAIAQLLSIISYLEEIDEFAPALFFTHPQWSTTQISDRYIELQSKADAEHSIERSADLVSGIYSRFGPTYYSIKSSLEADYAAFADPEQTQYISVPENAILIRTYRQALLELATYYEKIRVCCEHIQNQINTLIDGSILENLEFLDLLVRKSMEKTLSETTLWDFKQTFPVWDSPTGKNKEKLALKLASYANNKGGILIVGISDDRKIIGVEKIEDRIKQTKELIDRIVENTDHGINVATIPLENELGEKVSCLLILIPQNCELTAVTKTDSTVVYPYRDGVETKYKTLAEISAIKGAVMNNNFRFARDLINFVYRNGVIG